MFIIWGKRTYGAVDKVGTTSVKTVFGHLYYLPLFPMSSHYVDFKTGNSYELTRMDGRSVLCGYLRIWMPLMLAIALVVFDILDGTLNKVLCALVMALTAVAAIGSFVYDKKVVRKESAQVREMMHRHFGVALDPYRCRSSLQADIEERVRAHSNDALDASWYKRTLDDAVSQPHLVEMAVLRARCDQHDGTLQTRALQRLPGARKAA
ncbi:hypothetical protein [Massilia mucilaginosa]|uniref:hypothetical protein n=1 Tax=Massilia mucilaginosa TaxID=2609282 RepID=UPI0014201AC1|nr:hypothetical protein [Massilia mucilaginosa]